MKKIKKLLSNNLKTITAFIIGGIIFGGTTAVVAAVIAANQVTYTPPSGVSANNVQTAIDELYTRASKWLNPNDMGTPQYYATTGTYKGWCNSTDTNCNSYADFPTTSTTPPAGKNIYAVKYEDGQYGVCIKRNGKEHCFRGRNYKAEAKHVQEVFSDISCSVYSENVYCDASDFYCYVDSNGYVGCGDYGAGSSCYVYSAGSVYCS
ncbi:MAG: hypothetical protein ACI31V_05645 [Bacilli bacterium]